MALRSIRTLVVALALFSLTPLRGLAQEGPPPPPAGQQAQEGQGPQGQGRRPNDPMSTPTFAGLRLRSIGPALTSGRVVDFAVDPNDRTHYFVASAAGGVWKTVNAGTTYTPVFDNEGSYSIGVVVLDPNNPSVVWVGTGENNSQRSVSYGDGVYRSDDAGRSWKNMGLKQSEHIGRIVIDPRNSDTVYVAAQGPLWGPGGDRGLYKTTDGGKNWKKVINGTENTGVTDIVMDPRNPDVLYAATYQRRRHVYGFINGGPESAIYKSIDAGANWTRLRSGLPNEDMGRIGLAIAPQDSNIIYATIEAANRRGGIFRSNDRGATWERRNEFEAGSMYYAQIYVDPKNVDRLYIMNVNIQVSDDGGRTIRPLGERSKHVDNHVMWIDPKDTNYYLVGCDGGIYESFDRAANWSFKANLPVTQFYDIALDNATPFYNVYGGTQDNFSLGGPTRTKNVSGITNADWYVTQGGDGFTSQVDQEDPDTAYAESQFGGLVRYNRATGERVGIQPQTEKGEPPVRWNWDSPLIISSHSHTRLYFAANKLYRSDDRGDTWKPISGELSRGIDRNTLPIMGKVWGPDAVAKNQSTTLFGDAVAIAESPKKEGLIYVGTDDGLIQITENGGKTWTKVDKFPGVPDMSHVRRIVTSQHDANTVYVAFDNHKANSDFAPYLLKSTDTGKSWTPIKGNLPANGPVLSMAEDPVNPNLIFVGTEFGLFFTIDGGQKYVQLKGGLPTVAVADLAIQKRENDLVVGTFGRGIYVLDNYTPLRVLKPEMLNEPAVVFPVKDALMYIQAQPYGGGAKSFQGEAFYEGANPAYGATFTYFLKESPRTKKQKRQEAERAAARAAQRNPDQKPPEVRYPTDDELRAEAAEEAPEVFLTISDAQGKPIRTINGSMAAGMNRVIWDLRFPPPTLGGGGGGRGGGGNANPEGEQVFGGGPSGSLVMPGKYTVRLSQRVDGTFKDLGEAQSFNIIVPGAAAMSAADRAALVEFQQKVSRLQRAVNGTLATATETKARITQMKRAIADTPTTTHQLADQASAIDKKLDEILLAFRGDTVMRGYNENTASSITERVGNIVGGERMSTARPTQTHKDDYEIAAQELTAELAKLRRLLEVDIVKLEKDMEAAGAPWVPGHLPDWHEK